MPERPPDDLGFGADMPLIIDGANTRAHSLTLLLITSPTCGYCQASTQFHAAMLKAAAEHATPLYVAVPELKAAGSYLESSGLNRAIVKEWKQIRAHVNGTPTLIAADSTSVVRRVWLGQLSKAREDEVFAVIADPNRLAQIRPAHLDTGGVEPQDGRTRPPAPAGQGQRGRCSVPCPFRNGPRTRRREHPDGGSWVRAPWELDQRRVQVVDCSYFTQSRCDLAVNRLVDTGFHAAALNAGSVVR
jgi:hypothetical protein